ncbi:MAG: helix-turn-helix domain-containing protein [Bacilli bacterium]
MSTEYKIYYTDESELYVNKSKEEKERIRLEIVKMAPERGIKPTARYFKTYPSTVRNIMKIYKEKGEEGLKFKR